MRILLKTLCVLLLCLPFLLAMAADSADSNDDLDDVGEINQTISLILPPNTPPSPPRINNGTFSLSLTNGGRPSNGIIATVLLVWAGVLVAKEFAIYYMMTGVSEFYTVLPAKDKASYDSLMAREVGYMVAIAAGLGISKFFSGVVSILFRNQATWDLLHSYVKSPQLYRTIFASGLDNPDHRVSTDVDAMTQLKAKIFEGGLVIPILIVYYSVLTHNDMGWRGIVSFYGFFVVSALVTQFFMRPVANVVERKEKFEADYRLGHAGVVEDAESIAFARAEPKELSRLMGIFRGVLEKQLGLARARGLLEGVSQLFIYLGSILVYFVLSFQFFGGAYDDVDELSRASIISKSSFYSLYLINQLTNLIALAGDISQFWGYSKRVTGLQNAVAGSGEDLIPPSNGASLPPNTLLRVESLTVEAPEKRLFKDLSFDLVRGRDLLITGSNGRGKTSLTRVLSGLWKPMAGSVTFLPTSNSGRPAVMFLHQKPYVPYGSIYDQVAYPFSYETLTTEQQLKVQKLLAAESQPSALALKFSPALDPETKFLSSMEYRNMLSLGEQQKVAFLRLLFWKPDIAVLDESTASMDPASTAYILGRLKESGVTILAISHDENLLSDREHDRINLDDYSN